MRRHIVPLSLLAAGLALLVSAIALSRPDSQAGMWQTAEEFELNKSYEAAIEVYEQLAVFAPDDAQPLLAAGDIYLTQHRWWLAEDAFNRALVRSPQDARAQAGLAAARWGRGTGWQAIALWEEALVYDPTLFEARLALAQAYLAVGRPVEAKAVLEMGLNEAESGSGPQLGKEQLAQAHILLAMSQVLDDMPAARSLLLEILGDTSPAVESARDYWIAVLDQALETDSESQRNMLLGLALAEQGQWEMAGLALERSLAQEPANAEAMAFYGHVQGHLGRPALDYLETAVEAEPDWAVGHYLLADYYDRQGVSALVVPELEAALALDSSNVQFWMRLGQVYAGQGEYRAAQKALQQALNLDPGDLSTRLTLVQFYTDHSWQVAEAGIPEAKAALALAPDNAALRDLLGWMYYLTGDLDAARLELESSLGLDPGRASTYYHLGMLHQTVDGLALNGQERNISESLARKAFQRTIDLDTEGAYRDRAQMAIQAWDDQ